jgi:cysteine-rich repeat protein
VRLLPSGEPTAPPVPTFDFSFNDGAAGVAPAGDGFVVASQQLLAIEGQRFDATGTPVGAPFTIGQDGGIADTRMAAVPGGFLVVWGSGATTKARLYHADATPATAEFAVASGLRITGLAVAPTGTRAAIVGRTNVGDADLDEIRVVFFAPDGTTVGTAQTVGPLYREVAPDVASDASGNFLVVSGSPFRARAYDQSGNPFGAMVALGLDNFVGRANVAGRRQGGFFVLRTTTFSNAKTFIGAVTLCAPGSAVCGDGALVPTCEVCDMGAANSDTTPDACRTDCTPAHCGDGATDAGEECDDGNGRNCDGCNELCEIEAGATCGDGIVAPAGCRERCDDGNAAAGDGCSPTCRVEHVFGGGKLGTDCFAAWRVDNTSNEPRFAKKGGVNPQQRCRDDDPACDFDGGVVGSCTFHVAVCVNNSEPLGCFPRRLQSWTLAAPTPAQSAARPALAAVRDALQAAVVPNVVGSGDPDDCSPDADVVLPLRGAPGAYKSSTLKLKARATVYDGTIDTDALRLRCDP